MVEISEKNEFQLTEQQIFSLSETLVIIFKNLKKYKINIQEQINLSYKIRNDKKTLQEFYTYQGLMLITEINCSFDLVYIYTTEKIIIKHFEIFKEYFNNHLDFFVKYISDKNVFNDDYVEVLEEYRDKIDTLIKKISITNIYKK